MAHSGLVSTILNVTTARYCMLALYYQIICLSHDPNVVLFANGQQLCELCFPLPDL